MLTSQILIQNHEKTIRRLLDSISPLGGEILVADVGCTDNTASICQQYSARIINAQDNSDRSQIRNTLSVNAKHDWLLFIEPWEALTEPNKIIDLLGNTDKTYSLSVLNGDLMTSEARLWNRQSNWRFQNPIFEFLNVPDDRVQRIHCTIFSDGQQTATIQQIQAWRGVSAATTQPIYYEAFYHLGNNEWSKFLLRGQQYLFTEKKATQANVMIKYYMAVVLCHIKKRTTEALKHTVECLAIKPRMAELWCLLGDIHYHLMKEYKKAKVFYDNAIILGSQRDILDGWPMEISKYKRYPSEMIENCDKVIKNTSYVKLVQGKVP